jgi:acyl-coenzyme A synthetase/AMP-(fatty) acid ligase
MSSVIDMVQFWARAKPDYPAIVQSELITTYRALSDAIESIAERVERLNLEKTAPVAVSIANPSFTLATIFALLRVGYNVASISPSLFPFLQRHDIRNLINDAQGQVMSGGRNIRFDLSWLPSDTTNRTSRSNSGGAADIGDMIFFTSGTTGLPKKITQTAGALRELLRYPFTSASGTHQKILIMPGLGSTFGFNRACEVLNAGKTACFAPSTEAALYLVNIFGVELIVASAAQAAALLDFKKQNPGYRIDSLTGILIGGGKLSAYRLNDICADLCRTTWSQYGSTEAGVVAIGSFELMAAAPGAVGVVLPWVELEVVDEAGAVLPAGSAGSIRYRTPQLIENLKSADAAGFPGAKDGWFYPGDVGSLGSDRMLRLTGRISDVINRGGVKISSSKIEEVLEALPEVKAAAACGVEGLSGMEEVWVAIVAEGPVDVARIKQQLLDHTEVKISPDEVMMLSELPRGELGKVQKYRLRELMLEMKSVT